MVSEICYSKIYISLPLELDADDLPELLIWRSLEFCKFRLQSLVFLAAESDPELVVVLFFFFTSCFTLVDAVALPSVSMLDWRFFLQNISVCDFKPLNGQSINIIVFLKKISWKCQIQL